MSEIHLLPSDLVNKIAAGEVVERPASVVKELLDNAIDAGADNIIVEIKNGGEQLIKVIDNGKGIKKEDLKLAIESHATSKLKTVEDLNNILTLGFRGEALASISSVSKFILKSKHKDEDFAYSLKLQENGEIEISKTAMNQGTIVEVADLFYNVPARKKFLKTINTEFSHIVNTFINYVLVYPNISFKLIHNEREFASYPKVDNLDKRIAQVLSEDLFNTLSFIERTFDNYKIQLFISKNNQWQSNRKHQYIFVNKRAVSNYLLNKAIMDGIGHLIPPKQYPYYILLIDIDPKLVDVNVHPRKLEVKFLNEGELFKNLRNLVWDLMNSSDLLKKDFKNINDDLKTEFIQKPNQTIVNKVFSSPSKKTASAGNLNLFKGKQNSFNLEASKKIYANENISFNKSKLEIKDWKKEIENIREERKWQVIGQVDKKFIILQMPESLWILDQHALAEGILYKKLKNEFDENKSIAKQALLMPESIELTSWQIALLEEYKDVLEDLSFEIENFGANTYVIQAIPADLVKMPIKELFIQLLNELALEDKNLSLEQKRDRILKYTACRSAIKFGDELTLFEMEKLIEEMFDLSVYTCAHGRPVYWEIPYDELLKKFQR